MFNSWMNASVLSGSSWLHADIFEFEMTISTYFQLAKKYYGRICKCKTKV